MKRRLRFVLATPICDGHDAAIVAITRLLRTRDVEAVYIGFNKSPQQIVKAALEEDADAIAISSYNGGHVAFLKDVLKERREQRIPKVPVFCGGGGTILSKEVGALEKLGVTRVYRPPMDLAEAIDDMIARATKAASSARPALNGQGGPFLNLARGLTAIELGANGGGRKAAKARATANGSKAATVPVWGINGRGGAGKSTIVDELIFRFLHRCKGNIAVLSVDPTLADRVRMLYCYSPRVYLRSVGLGPGEAIEKKIPPMIEALRGGPFQLALVESVGLGQNDLGVAPFVDRSIYCMTPEYGSDLQLEKEALLRRAEIVVMNKRDYPQAETRGRRVRNFLGKGQNFILTEAKRHGDVGVDELFDQIATRSGIALITRGAAAEAPDGVHIAPAVPPSRRGYLGAIVDAHEAYYREMEEQKRQSEADPKVAEDYKRRFATLRKKFGFDGPPTPGPGESIEDGVLYREDGSGRKNPVARETTCGIWVPVVGMPEPDAGSGQIVSYLYKQNVPGEFPFTEGAFNFRRTDEDPIRMFAGLGLPETTNKRFHLLSKRGGAIRLSTAFDSLTLYGIDSDEPGAFAKVGEGGVAVDTVEDMTRLYAGFNLEEGSVSLTMSGPAPTILAMYLAAAKRRGFEWKKLRGTIQTDILKEIQAQNEAILPLDPSLRLIADMLEFCGREAPLWYPISISGYHIHEAGANPIQELAFTLANGFTYLELLRSRGLPLEDYARRLSFFFTAGSEVEFNVLGRVARRIWAVGLKRYFGLEGPGLRLKFHTQTSGRSLQDVEPLHNLARVTLQAERGLHNATNSLHTNSYKETYTTPEEDDVILAMGCQQIPLVESGDFRFIENLNQGAYGLSYLEDEVERAVQRIFREIDSQGGVIPAIENEYFRTVIQEEVQKAHRAIREGRRKIVGVNTMNFGEKEKPRGALVQIAASEKRKQIARTQAFKKKHRREAEVALRRLQETALAGGNVFAELLNTVETATVGQVTHALWEVWGRFRPSM